MSFPSNIRSSSSVPHVGGQTSRLQEAPVCGADQLSVQDRSNVLEWGTGSFFFFSQWSLSSRLLLLCSHILCVSTDWRPGFGHRSTGRASGLQTRWWVAFSGLCFCNTFTWKEAQTRQSGWAHNPLSLTFDLKESSAEIFVASMF